MNTKGQVAIFVILAVIIVAGVGLFFAFRDSGIDKGNVPAEVNEIYGFVVDCIKTSGENVLNEVGVSEKYYVSNKKIAGFSKNELEKEISEQVSEEIVKCAGNFEEFPMANVSKEFAVADVEIKNDRVNFDVMFPVTIKIGESVYNKEDFGKIAVFNNIGLMNNIALEISNQYILNNGFNLSYLSDADELYKVKANLEHYEMYSAVRLSDKGGYEFRFNIE